MCRNQRPSDIGLTMKLLGFYICVSELFISVLKQFESGSHELSKRISSAASDILYFSESKLLFSKF